MSEDFFTAKKEHKTYLYKDTITGLNSEYLFLLNAYTIGDTRVVYLRRFEAWLSMNCPQPLWSMNRYVYASSRYPLGRNVNGYVSRGKFLYYIAVYELIMRDIGLIGHRDDEKDPETAVFDMGEQ